MKNDYNQKSTPRFLSTKRKLKFSLEQELNQNFDLPNKIKNKITYNFLKNDLTLILPSSFQVEDSKNLYKESLTHGHHNKFLTNYNNDNSNTNPVLPVSTNISSNSCFKTLNFGKVSSSSDFSNLHTNQEFLNKQKQLITQIDEISNEIKVYERRAKRDQIIKVIEKVSDVLDEDLICVDHLKDYNLFGKKMHDLANELIIKNQIEANEKALKTKSNIENLKFDFDFSKIEELIHKKCSSERIHSKNSKTLSNQLYFVSSIFTNSNKDNKEAKVLLKNTKDKTSKIDNINYNIKESESSNSFALDEEKSLNKSLSTSKLDIDNKPKIEKETVVNLNNNLLSTETNIIVNNSSKDSNIAMSAHDNIKKKLFSQMISLQKTCYHCLGGENTLTTCENCSSSYHPYCESFKGLFNIEGKNSITICNECFTAYKENNLIKKENKTLFDNCEFQIQNLSLKLKFRIPKVDNFVQNINKTNASKNKSCNDLSKYFISLTGKLMTDLNKNFSE